MQTPLWPALLADVDLAGPPFSAVTFPGAQAWISIRTSHAHGLGEKSAGSVHVGLEEGELAS